MESDTDHYKKRDLNNWLFLRFNTISILDPKLYQNYLYGGQFLNIVKDDLEGAKLLYDKGLHYFPNDYDLNFQTGFLYYFEIGDSKNGLKYLSRVEQHPKAPLFLRSITNKLRFEVGGDREEIFKLVLINYQITKDPMLKARLKNDLYSIRAEIDLICLNSQGKNCHTRDIDGSPYLLEGGIYKTSKPFKPYRIKSRIKK
jgi:hypothetical protein